MISPITRRQKAKLRKIANKIVTQSFNHEKNIEQYFEQLVDAARAEFTEDNGPTLHHYLTERLRVVLDEKFGEAIDNTPVLCSRCYKIGRLREQS